MWLRILVLSFLSFNVVAYSYPQLTADVLLREQLCERFDQVIKDSRFAAPEQRALLQSMHHLALEKNAHAQTIIANHYIDGRAVPQDWKIALCWYRAAAGNGSAYAKYWLGIFYHQGYIVKQSTEMAAFWFNQAAKSKNAIAAQTQVADRYADKNSGVYNQEYATFWYQRSAKENNLAAELALAELYVDTYHTSHHKQAIKWYNKAVKQHSVDAAYNIGLIYYNGQGVPVNYKQAYQWLSQAAKAGYAPAQYSLANLYYYGQGVQRDAVKAYAWLSIANIAGNNPAISNLQEHLIKSFTPEQLKEASLLSYQYKKQFTAN